MTIEISDDVHSLFHAELERRDGAYVLSVPESEIETGALSTGSTYRVALTATAAEEDEEEDERRDQDRGRGRSPGAGRDDPSPPVAEGDELAVVIEDQGDEGDGIARVGPGFIVFVPDTEPGDRVRIEITDVTGSYAFGEVIERIATTA